MTGREFTARAKKLGATVKKVKSAYWGETWYQTVFVASSQSFQIDFKENKSEHLCHVSNGNGWKMTADDLEKDILVFQAVVTLLREINQ